MTVSTAFVTGADRGLGLALCAGLLERGWRVFAGQYMPEWDELNGLSARYPGLLTSVPLDVSLLSSAQTAASLTAEQTPHIDLLINNAGVNTNTKEQKISDGQDYDEIFRLYSTNAVSAIRVVEAFFPLIERSELKRLAFVSSEAGSIERCKRTSWYGYTMSKAALNRAVRLMFNDLHPEGYTFRLYHPGYLQSYIRGHRNMEAKIPLEESAEAGLDLFLNPLADEGELAMYDWRGEKWPW